MSIDYIFKNHVLNKKEDALPKRRTTSSGVPGRLHGEVLKTHGCLGHRAPWNSMDLEFGKSTTVRHVGS